MHISALASAIKVTPRKLEALEADRFDELPDATFTRALAQTVCRALKIDAAPVLALLPRAGGGRGLGHLGEGLNTPFREGYGHAADNDESLLGRPAVWAPLVVLLIAAAVYFAPANWFDLGRDRPDASAALGGGAPLAVAPVHASPGRAESGAGTTVSVAASAVAAFPAPAVARVPGADAASAAGSVGADRVAMNEASPEASAGSNSAARLAGSASMAAAAIALASAPAGASAEAPPVLLQLHAVRDSWIEVTDVHGQALLSRTLKSGERVGLEGDLPLRLRIGNVAGTEVSFRGRAVALEPYNRNNLARFELK
jgi:cytoskeleton protein RodZ